MKKILPLMLAALIFFPAVAVQAAADVPDFRVVAGNNVRFFNSEWSNDGGHITYEYICDLDLDKRENFAAKFVNYLRANNYPFVLTKNAKDDYISTSAHFIERWVFDYTGSKNISKVRLASPALGDFRGHILVQRFRYFLEDVTKIQIRVANGLTYGGGN